MKSRLLLFVVCLTVTLTLFIPAANAQDAFKAAVAVEAPAVPQSDSAADYLNYLNQNEQGLQSAVRNLVDAAQKDNVDANSDQYAAGLSELISRFSLKAMDALNKGLSLKNVSNEELLKFVEQKINLLPTYCQITGSNQDDEMTALSNQLRQIGRPDIADALDEKIFNDKVKKSVKENDAETFGKLFDVVNEQVQKAGKDITPELAFKATKIALAARDVKGYKLEDGLLKKYVEQFASSSNPDVQYISTQMELQILFDAGEEKMFALPGNEILFSGTFIDGTKFNPEDYKGKVLLIEVWATWCPPCCEEQTVVRDAYAKYHDKGFEVIGISCDDENDLDGFKEFLDTYKFTWKQMFENKAVIPGMKTVTGQPVPFNKYYGIYKIPRPILIGKDGKVITVNARGPELERRLKEIYGDGSEE
ncbi:MAG: TlpA family protein disulfide reductase [Thermoguttaceae bacterium]|nr:TlpA family protein disulfide reductase [Thermoguttaceae bacterium]